MSAAANDAALERQLREALIESRQRYKDLVEISSDFAWETDAAGKFTFVSPKGVLGWAPNQLLGRTAGDFLSDPSEPNVFATALPPSAEVWFRRADGGSARLSLAAMPLKGADGSQA